MDALVQLYAAWKQRNVLHGPLPVGIPMELTDQMDPFSYNNDRMPRERAVAIFEKEFRKAHLTIIPDGDKFVLLVPDSQKDAARALLRKHPFPASETNANVIIAAPGATVHDLLQDVYKDAVGAKGIETNNCSPIEITLRVQGINIAQAIHALDIVIGLHGLKVERTVDDKIKAVPLTAK